jgi:hypothetical protein
VNADWGAGMVAPGRGMGLEGAEKRLTEHVAIAGGLGEGAGNGFSKI